MNVNPALRPAVYVREAIPRDAPFLMAAAKSNRFKTLNFPEGVSELFVKIQQKSQRSFRRSIPDLAEQELRFSILSGLDEFAVPIGTSTLYPKHGTPIKPHHAYRAHDDFLEFIQDVDGPAEVGAMIVHKKCQGREDVGRDVEVIVEEKSYLFTNVGGYGRVGSWVRFFWAALPENRAYFRDRNCLSEFLPPFSTDEKGHRTNAFYEAVGKKAFQKPYDEMDRLTDQDREPLLNLPKRIPMADLPTEALEIIGKAGEATIPAVRLLEKLGFLYSGQVDPLDAGPHYIGRFSDNPIFTGARDLYFDGTAQESLGESGSVYGFIGCHRLTGIFRFEACAAPFRMEGGRLKTTPETAARLELKKGDQVTVSPFPD